MMKKVLFFTFVLALVNSALCDSIFKSDYSDFSMAKLFPLSDKEYAYQMDKMCQSKYKFSGKEEICADFYYYWKGFKNERSK